jgi:predicted RNase H-like nuclease (RuvC/YqgF family)
MSNFNNTVLPIAPGLDEYIADTYNVEQMIQRLQDQFHSTIQLQANQIIELQSEIAVLKRSQQKSDETVSDMNSEMERFNRWAVVNVEEMNELREMIEQHDIGGLAKEMKAKNIEYTSMSRVFTRDLAELCHIRNRIVPKMERLIHWMSTQPDAKRFLEENDLNRSQQF